MTYQERIIPTLTGKEAQRFLAEAEAAEKEARECKPVDRTKERESMRAILRKAKL